MNAIQIKPDAIVPSECGREGWNIIKDQIWVFLTMTLLIMILDLVPLLSLVYMGPLSCSLYYSILTKMRGQSVEYKMIFAGFKHFIPTMIVGLVIYLPTLVIGISQAFSFKLSFLPGIVLILVFLVFVVLYIVWVFAVSFAYPLVIDYKLSASEALKLSFKATKENLGGIIHLGFYYGGLVLIVFFLFFILGFILAQISGVLALLVLILGMFAFYVLTNTILVAMSVIAYKQIFLDEFPRINKMGSTGLTGLGLDI